MLVVGLAGKKTTHQIEARHVAEVVNRIRAALAAVDNDLGDPIVICPVQDELPLSAAVASDTGVDGVDCDDAHVFSVDGVTVVFGPVPMVIVAFTSATKLARVPD